MIRTFTPRRAASINSHITSRPHSSLPQMNVCTSTDTFAARIKCTRSNSASYPPLTIATRFSSPPPGTSSHPVSARTPAT
jgi:hypothetical protein